MKRREFLQSTGGLAATLSGLGGGDGHFMDQNQDDEDYGDFEILSDNGFYTFLGEENLEGEPRAFDEAGLQNPDAADFEIDDQYNIIGSLVTNPKNPHSRGSNETQSDAPEFEELLSAELDDTRDEDSGLFMPYKVSRDYNFPTNDKGIGIDWKVTAPQEHGRFALAELEMTCLHPDDLLVAQDPGDIHEGFNLIQNANLNEEIRDDDSYSFFIPGEGSQEFGESGRTFTVHPGADFVTVYDDTWGATYGLISGDTDPNMIVEKEGGDLDYMVDEILLENNGGEYTEEELGNYLVVAGVHPGGEEAPEHGQEMYEEAREYEGAF